MAGTARKVISAKYTGVGDTYVPIEQLVCLRPCVRVCLRPCARVCVCACVRVCVCRSHLMCVPIEQLLSTICDAQKCDTHMGDANMW